jgi:GLPGLI family protein
MKNNVFPLLFFIMLTPICLLAQIRSGKITYERKTNLYKKYKGENMRRWIEESNKIKTDYFELNFNDSLAFFRPQESELKEDYSWATQKNTVYQNFKQNTRITIKSIWGEQVYLSDTLYTRKWKITYNKRNIGGYDCRKAIWQVNDSTRIYAWYADAINISTGPESFIGLPGAILGLATEDGGVVYFAKKIEIIKNDPRTLVLTKKVKKYYTPAELKLQLQKDYGKESWGKAMIKSTFDNW